MSFKHILNEIENTATGVNSRRDVLKNFGSKVALAALPLGIGSLFQTASAKTAATDTVIEALNFFLELEYFTYNYYRTANNTGGLIPADAKAGFLTVENHKKAHIVYLNGSISNMGGTPYTPKNYDASAANPFYIVSGTYDFTASGKYNVFSYYPDFIMLAEVFEDIILRAYKGELPAIINDNAALEQMMRLQSANGRHASHARFVRRRLDRTLAPEHPAPWITKNIAPKVDFVPDYNGEDAIGQQTIDITALPGITGTTPLESATAAFDEPLEKGYVLSSLAKFRK